MKKNKVLLSLGVISTIIAPVGAVISCGSNRTNGTNHSEGTLAPWDDKYLMPDAKVVFPDTMSMLQGLMNAGSTNNLKDYINTLINKFEKAAHQAGHVSLFGDGMNIDKMRASADTLADASLKISKLIKLEVSNLSTQVGPALFSLIDDQNEHYVEKAAKELLINDSLQIGFMKFLAALKLDREAIHNEIEVMWFLIKDKVKSALMTWSALSDTESIDMYVKENVFSTSNTNIFESKFISGSAAENSLQSVDFRHGEDQLKADTFKFTAMVDRLFTNIQEKSTSPSSPSTRSASSHKRSATSSGIDMKTIEGVLTSVSTPNFQNLLSGIFVYLSNISWMNDEGSNPGFISKFGQIFASEVVHEDGKSGLAGTIVGQDTHNDNVLNYIDWNIGRASDTSSDATKKEKFAKFIAARDAMLTSNYYMETQNDDHVTITNLKKFTLAAGDLIPLNKTYKFQGHDVTEVKFKNIVQTYDLSMYFKLIDGLLSFIMGSMPAFGMAPATINPDFDTPDKFIDSIAYIPEYIETPIIIDRALDTIQASGYVEGSNKDIEIEKVIVELKKIKAVLDKNYKWVEYLRYKRPFAKWDNHDIKLSDLPGWFNSLEPLARLAWADDMTSYNQFKTLCHKNPLNNDDISALTAFKGTLEHYLENSKKAAVAAELTPAVLAEIKAMLASGLIVARYNTHITNDFFRTILCAI